VLAVLLLALNLQAQTTDSWRATNNPATHGLWSEAANWSLARLPGMSPTTTGDKADFNAVGQIPCFVNSVAAPAQLMIGDNGPGDLIILSGGSLVTSNYSGVNSYNAVGYNSLARLELQNGGSLMSSNHFWVGLNRGAISSFAMNGGAATVLGMFGVGWSGGVGIAQINGGTLTLAQWNDTSSISPLSQLDIRSGTVVITNDHTSSIANFIANGRITGYGGVGTVNYSLVSDSVSTQTVLTATCPVGAGGPYPVTNGQFTAGTAFPTNINPNLFAHYWTLDAATTPPNGNWLNCLGLVTGGDQATADVTFRGLPGKQATQANINIYDQNWQVWNTNGLIDILMCVYGDGGVLRSPTDTNQCRRLQFLCGTLPTDSSSTVYGGMYATNAYNSQWNWILFTITNNFQTNYLGDREVGSIKTNIVGTAPYGGINGGTIRIQGPDNGGATGLSIRAVAFGQHGVFGTAPDINQFVQPDGSCPPVLGVNLVGIDLNAGYTNHLQVINDPATSQDVTFANNIGPAGDKRKAVIPNGYYLNFGIVSNYLGQPCNDNVTMKVCVDYYDDPAFAGAGVTFGPYAYATDNLGDIAYLTSGLVTLQGTGQWIHQSWVIPNVNLMGVSTAPLTGGPQFISANGQVAVSRCYIAALRTSGPLAGQDPLADCYQDPNICYGVYGTYAELDLAHGVTNGVDVGTSGADQTQVVEMAGPLNDQRLSVRPDYAPSYYMNFQILTNALGPDSQGNVHLAMLVTYYDDPALAGHGFRPQVWNSQQFNVTAFTYMTPAENIVLQGTGTWRDAYWELGTIFLKGIGQAHAAARFECDSPIHISRIRYAVIRPCGPTADQNLLSSKVPLAAAPDTNALVRLSWPYQAPQAVLQAAPALGGTWSSFAGTPVVEGGTQSVLRFGPTNANNQFFRLNLTPQ
jgi:hypothetical protein